MISSERAQIFELPANHVIHWTVGVPPPTARGPIHAVRQQGVDDPGRSLPYADRLWAHGFKRAQELMRPIPVKSEVYRLQPRELGEVRGNGISIVDTLSECERASEEERLWAGLRTCSGA